MKKSVFFTLLVVLSLMSLSLTRNTTNISAIGREYWPTDGWLTKSLQEVNINQERIESMFEYIDDNNYDIDSVSVIKNGYLIVEEYLNEEYIVTDLHAVHSVTKSVSSALIGIAIDEGYIAGIDQRILDFFEDVSVLNKADKENITIEHLLTHTSGIYWRESQVSYGSPENSFNKLADSPNWVEFILNETLEYEPGTVRNYNSGDSHLLSAIITNATGKSTLEYATEHLFNPLGIKKFQWPTDPQGIYEGGNGLMLRPRGMAKFGFLYLNNGSWDDSQLVPKEWVINSTKNPVVVSDWSSYGYQWWVYPQVNSYLALGFAGQIIWITPEHDLVIVFTSSLYDGEWPITTLAVEYIINAIEEGYVEKTSSSVVSIILSIVTVVCLPKILKLIKD